MCLGSIQLPIPPGRSLVTATEQIVRKALSTPGSVITAKNPPVKINCRCQMNVRPSMTTVDHKNTDDISPGFFLAHHARSRFVEEERKASISTSTLPLYVDKDGQWLTEAEAKKTFRIVVQKRL